MVGTPEQAIVFQAMNKHNVSCGIPPHITTQKNGNYYGYFENQHGEQMIFVYDHETKKATLWAGDNGWNDPVAVENGKATEIGLNSMEQAWLQLCWVIATA